MLGVGLFFRVVVGGLFCLCLFWACFAVRFGFLLGVCDVVLWMGIGCVFVLCFCLGSFGLVLVVMFWVVFVVRVFGFCVLFFCWFVFLCFWLGCLFFVGFFLLLWFMIVTNLEL